MPVTAIKAEPGCRTSGVIGPQLTPAATCHDRLVVTTGTGALAGRVAAEASAPPAACCHGVPIAVSKQAAEGIAPLKCRTTLLMWPALLAPFTKVDGSGGSPDLIPDSLVPATFAGLEAHLSLAWGTTLVLQGVGVPETVAPSTGTGEVPRTRFVRSCRTLTTRSASSKSCTDWGTGRGELPPTLLCRTMLRGTGDRLHLHLDDPEATVEQSAPTTSTNAEERKWPRGEDSPPPAMGLAPGRAPSGRADAQACCECLGCEAARRAEASNSASVSSSAFWA
mmetsp:Transcript_141552/g.394505  ORF Transcript_141552/g.394505 Transcript_141552/m.394505 type:complete len:280 (-) Transcript_141552:785-1624(-)